MPGKRRKRVWLAIACAALLAVPLLYGLIRGIRPLALFAKPENPAAATALVYKQLPDRDLELALYPPTRTLFRKSPVLVYIHGGSWKSGTHRLKSSELEGIFNPIRSLGIAVVSVQYSLTDQKTHFPAHLEDVTDALKFIVNQAQYHNLDANRVGLLGASAGAHLALLAASSDIPLRCVVGIATPVDLVDLSDYSAAERVKIEKLLADFMGGTYAQKPELYKQGSPIARIRPDWPPLFLAHGEKDDLVPSAQVDRFYQAGEDAGLAISYIRVENGQHDLSPDPGAEATPSLAVVVQKLLLFLLRYLIL
ncbi:MAG: alpha/beta hydrolase [Clostridiaceae bacterium]|nr:alpha/beta hydrolase [Clostridiaceae bacterium]